MRDESRGRPIQKAKVEIILGKSEQFNDLMAAAAEEREVAAEVDDHSQQFPCTFFVPFYFVTFQQIVTIDFVKIQELERDFLGNLNIECFTLENVKHWVFGGYNSFIEVLLWEHYVALQADMDS